MIRGRLAYFKSICIILFIFLIILFSTNSNAKNSDIISFNSYFDLDYNQSLLNQELKINKSLNIPLTIIYTSDFTEDFFNKTKIIPFPLLRNKILFNRSMVQQVVNVHLTNAEEITWAHINLTQNKIYVDEIPYYKQAVKIKISLIISPFEEAPAETETIKLKVSCEDLGILKGAAFTFTIQFKPRFTPLITITPEESLQLTKPGDAINYKIKIKNHSNKQVRIDSKILTTDPKWLQTINPQSMDIDANDSNNFTFSAIPPNEFGWYDERQEFNLTIHAQHFPIQTNNSLNRSYDLTLKAKNYGISTPGFTMIGFFTILLFFFILKKINFKNKRSEK